MGPEIAFGHVTFTPRGGRMHVRVRGTMGEPVACGVVELDLFEKIRDNGWMGSITLSPAAECLHGGTYRDPAPWWEGS